MYRNEPFPDVLSRRFEPLLDIVQKFADEDGRGAGAVVLDVLAGVTYVQNLAGGEDGFQEEVTVVLAARPVAGTGALAMRSKPGVRSCRG